MSAEIILGLKDIPEAPLGWLGASEGVAGPSQRRGCPAVSTRAGHVAASCALSPPLGALPSSPRLSPAVAGQASSQRQADASSSTFPAGRRRPRPANSANSGPVALRRLTGAIISNQTRGWHRRRPPLGPLTARLWRIRALWSITELVASGLQRAVTWLADLTPA